MTTEQLVEQVTASNKVVAEEVAKLEKTKSPFRFEDFMPQAIKDVLTLESGALPSLVKRSLEATLGMRLPEEAATFEQVCAYVNEHYKDIVMQNAYAEKYSFVRSDAMQEGVSEETFAARAKAWLANKSWIGFVYQHPETRRPRPAPARRRNDTVAGPDSQGMLTVTIPTSVQADERYIHRNSYYGAIAVTFDRDDLLEHFGVESVHELTDRDIQMFIRDCVRDVIEENGVHDTMSFDDCHDEDWEELYDVDYSSLHLNDNALDSAIPAVQEMLSQIEEEEEDDDDDE